ncbi:hypothetical protein GH714_029234 [Hevea brasiliensis]|uniref:CLASP N-terminal domain-containing protein n=1 Tax=Hevea brasiliensis TaxID=3981 RepID=A0A6A6KLH9_HEVBR|nr:hypothetical protein GH714_029234 [Hevea brasiliensis]
MALRPIDNALPLTPERPKKQAKVSVPIQKQAEFAVNDENKAPLPLSADAAIDYSSENLKAIPDPESKIQLLQLLLKASQDKRFVCEEADKALSAMVRSMTPLHLLHKLRAYVSHANLRVRAKVAICISNSVSNMDLEGMKEFGLVSLVQMAANLLNDRLPEAREAARNTVISIFEAYTENEEQKQESWQNFCQSNLPTIHAQSMAKITSL